MPSNIRNKLIIKNKRLDEINAFLVNPNNELVNNLLSVVEKAPERLHTLFTSITFRYYSRLLSNGFKDRCVYT